MVRAKFKCASISPASWHDGADEIELYPVVGGSDNAENDAFYAATPGGKIILGTVNKAASDQFEVGKEYYVDFSPANPDEVNLEPGGESN